MYRTLLEANFGSKLHGSGIVPSVNLTERAACDARVDRVWTPMIERVESLEAKLEVYAFGEPEVLEQRGVPQLEAWPQNSAGTFRAEVANRLNECSGIKELRRALWSVGIADQISADLSGRSARHVQPRVIVQCIRERIDTALCHGDRLSSLNVDDSRNLPSSEKQSCDTSIVSVEGQFVGVAGHEDLGRIECRQTIVPFQVVCVGYSQTT